MIKMNGFIKEKLGTTSFTFVRDDVTSIVAADDSRMCDEYINQNGDEQVYEQMAKEYLDDWTLFGFVLHNDDSTHDYANVLAMSIDAYRPEVIMIDTHNVNWPVEMFKVINAKMILAGYGIMPYTYENRSVYINKKAYAIKVKECCTRDLVEFPDYNLTFLYGAEILMELRHIVINEREIGKYINGANQYRIIVPHRFKEERSEMTARIIEKDAVIEEIIDDEEDTKTTTYVLKSK